MGRTGIFVGLVGLVAIAGAVVYATSLSDVRSTVPTPNVAPPEERVRVEVLNAGGVSGLARSATLELRGLGFDVVFFGNAAAFDRDSSVVLDRVGRPDLAQAVADALGIEAVSSEPDPNLFVDVTVLLGSSWTSPEPVEAGGGEGAAREPWDPRGWIGR